MNRLGGNLNHYFFDTLFSAFSMEVANTVSNKIVTHLKADRNL